MNSLKTFGILLGATFCMTSAAQKRFTLGAYGEAVASRNFYSDHFNRYQFPEKYKDDPSHGRFDLPHVTVNMGYDFGHGWTMGMEIEFEHGGTTRVANMRLRSRRAARLPWSSSGYRSPFQRR